MGTAVKLTTALAAYCRAEYVAKGASARLTIVRQAQRLNEARRLNEAQRLN